MRLVSVTDLNGSEGWAIILIGPAWGAIEPDEACEGVSIDITQLRETWGLFDGYNFIARGDD